MLIENKTDAPAQPDQAERYGKRGEEGVVDGLWENFCTCVVAPRKYLATNEEAQHYGSQVSYEEIHKFFHTEDTVRSKYRCEVLLAAIEQNRRGYSPTPNDDVTRFWCSYWEVVTDRHPELAMKQPISKPANSDWPAFRPVEFGKKIEIRHKMSQGFVDLQISGGC